MVYFSINVSLIIWLKVKTTIQPLSDTPSMTCLTFHMPYNDCNIVNSQDNQWEIFMSGTIITFPDLNTYKVQFLFSNMFGLLFLNFYLLLIAHYYFKAHNVYLEIARLVLYLEITRLVL